MLCRVVGGAPEPRVLRHGDEHEPTRDERRVDRAERAGVVVDVLEHIEGADRVELVGERQVACVELQQRDVREPAARVSSPSGCSSAPATASAGNASRTAASTYPLPHPISRNVAASGAYRASVSTISAFRCRSQNDRFLRLRRAGRTKSGSIPSAPCGASIGTPATAGGSCPQAGHAQLAAGARRRAPASWAAPRSAAQRAQRLIPGSRSRRRRRPSACRAP